MRDIKVPVFYRRQSEFTILNTKITIRIILDTSRFVKEDFLHISFIVFRISGAIDHCTIKREVMPRVRFSLKRKILHFNFERTTTGYPSFS